MTCVVDSDLQRVDWEHARAALAADDFDNGRSPAALRRSFEAAPHVAFAWDGQRLVGMARLLSDGVCNAYLVDVWTASTHRRRGIGSAMVRYLLGRVPGQHVGLQTSDAGGFYRKLGFRPQPEFLATVVGRWLDNDGNRETDDARRPWGSYAVVDDAPFHKVKRILVQPGQRLSYQRHERRAEHWYLVSGTAEVTIEGRILHLEAGDAVDIPKGAAHRVANPGDELLVFVEVQTGDYFGEDDIQRLDDDYGRAGTGG